MMNYRGLGVVGVLAIFSVFMIALLVPSNNSITSPGLSKATTMVNLAAENTEEATNSAQTLTSLEASSYISKQPHIILFTVDDMGWNDIGYTSTDLPEATEFMVKLASKSVKLTHYYTQPSCTPSRVTIMTGKWAYKNGFQNYELQHTDEVGVPLSNKLMGEHLQDNGYVCFSCRKKIEKEKGRERGQFSQKLCAFDIVSNILLVYSCTPS